MGDRLEQCETLKEELTTFVLDADGDLATALETYSAERLKQWSDTKLQGISRSDLAIDMFTTEGRVGARTVLDIFTETQPQLSEADQSLISSWQTTFNGLFVVLEATSDGCELMNWLTEKRYRVQYGKSQPEEKLSRIAPDEIVVARLSPITDADWFFSGPILLLGKLGKPKLAVAIGNFKNWFPNYLYGDAPELLEEAWKSVKRYHDDFVQFFDAEQITLSGYELNKKLKEYQQVTTQRQLEETGIDSSKSLQELMDQAGVSKEDMAESVEELGEDGRQVQRLLSSPKAIKMMTPSVDLPDEFRRADAVTVFVHPQWGQTFLKDYQQLTQLLQATDEESMAKADRLVQRYLNDKSVSAYVWQRLAAAHAPELEASLRRVLERPAFSLAQDLDEVLVEFNKPLEPRLPEIASVPIHLHNLFQEALEEVNRSSSKKKSKGKRRQKSGFAAS